MGFKTSTRIFVYFDFTAITFLLGKSNLKTTRCSILTSHPAKTVDGSLILSAYKNESFKYCRCKTSMKLTLGCLSVYTSKEEYIKPRLSRTRLTNCSTVSVCLICTTVVLPLHNITLHKGPLPAAVLAEKSSWMPLADSCNKYAIRTNSF